MRLHLSLLLLALPGAGLAAGAADPPSNAAYRMELPPLQPLDVSQAALYPRCARLPGRGNPELPNHACAVLQHDGGWRIQIYVNAEPGSGPAFSQSLALPDPDGDSSFELHSEMMVAEADGAAIVMVERWRGTGYAGGGAERRDLLLVRAGERLPARIVAELPLVAQRNVRACFDARDRQQRREACQDKYAFNLRLALDPAVPGGHPRFLLTSRAATYPGRRSGDSDSTTAPALRARDLDWWEDPICSYRRVLAWDEAAGAYRPDAPLPDCSDYLDI